MALLLIHLGVRPLEQVKKLVVLIIMQAVAVVAVLMKLLYLVDMAAAEQVRLGKLKTHKQHLLCQILAVAVAVLLVEINQHTQELRVLVVAV